MNESLYIASLSYEELLSLFLCEIKGDDDFYDILAHNIALKYRKPLENLLEHLSDKRLRAALFGLGAVGGSDSDDVIQKFLHHDDPLVVASAMDALRRTQVVPWSFVAHFLGHDSPYVRGAALRFARSRLTAASLPILKSALHDSSEIVRQNALDEMEDFVSKVDLDDIARCLADPSLHVQEAAKSVIQAILDQNQ